MKTKSKCFISYCHEDNNRDHVSFLIDVFRKQSKTTEFFYDVEIGVGKRFQTFMNLLDVVDMVIMLGSPEYRRRTVLGRDKGGGVGYEYEIIKQRYDQVLDEKRDVNNEFLSDKPTNHFEVLPICIKGDFSSSLPKDFQGSNGINAIDLTYFKLINRKKVSGGKKLQVPGNIESRFEKDLNKIIITIRAIHAQKQQYYKEKLKINHKLFGLDMLFYDTKSDFSNPKHSKMGYDDTLFVRTHVYKQVETQSAYILVGRKGSGKSAISQVLPIRQERFNTPYLGVIDIYANRDINLRVLYNFINKEFLSDSAKIFDRLKCFRYGWALFFRICVMNEIVSQIQSSNLSKSALKKIESIVYFVKELKKKQPDSESKSKSVFFAFAFGEIQRFIKHCIREARQDERFFMSDILAQFNLKNYLNYSIGERVIRDLNNYLEFLPKRFLITFDGFDTEIEKFREEGQFFGEDTLDQKVAFEVDWLHSLLLLINDIKQLKTGKEIIVDRFDFCVTIPNHRYLEILRNDIDSYRFQHRRKNLIWSGVELLIFLRKRLEVISNYRVNDDTAWESLVEVMKASFIYMPQDISFVFNGRHIKMNLFLYVLRHTFWRPRDIQLFYAHVITLCKDCYDHGHNVSSEAVRNVIANMTFEIIKDDFINEYKGTLRNIGSILQCFIGSKQILTYEELQKKIGVIEFIFPSSNKPEFRHGLHQKIKFLYQIGFLGLHVNQDTKERYNLFSNHIFIFTEGCKLLKTVNTERLSEYEYIIHPIFSEYLEINTRENGFVLEFTKDYIMDIEGFMKATNEDFSCD